MRIHIVAERELRAAAQRKGTYWVRWLTGVASFVVLIWLMWATDAFKRTGGAHDAFVPFAFITFFYCILMGAIRTADCISSERREGTLGLLFLTNLNSAEIMAGKLFSNALPTIYGLLAIFPMLAIPLLMGGVTLSEFLCTMLALLVAIAFSLGCGMLASVLCRRQFPAVALAMGLVIVLSTLTFLAAGILEEYRRGHWLVQVLASTSPHYALSAALEAQVFRANHFWEAIASVMGIAVLLLASATWLLSQSWRDRVTSIRGRKPKPADNAYAMARSPKGRRDARRNRQLTFNPFYWLVARRQAGAPIFLLIMAALVVLTVTGTTPLFSKLASPARFGSVVGEMFAWLCAAGALHVMTLYYAAMLGAQTFAEDKQAGALELIFSTPARVHTMLQGAAMAWRQRMLLPAMAVSITHAYAFWKIMPVALIQPPGNVLITAQTTQWDILLASLFNMPINGRSLEWSFVFVMRVVVLVLPLAFILWLALGRIGRWLGLRMKHPGFAPLLALTIVAVPSTLCISLMAIIAEEFHFYRLSDRIVVPAITGLSLLIILANCAVAAGWASRNLRDNFRTVVIGRFDQARRSWVAMMRSLLKLALKAAAAILILALLFVLFYAWQNFHSHRAWIAFQSKLKQKHISLDLASVLPAWVPEQDNFACATAFVRLTTTANPLMAPLFQNLEESDTLPDLWKAQRRLPLANFTGVIGMAKPSKAQQLRYTYPNNPQLPDIPDTYSGSTNNAEVAPLLLKHLEPYQADLHELATAAKRPRFQSINNLTALDILQTRGPELLVMRRLHLIYTLRALALLHSGNADAAAEDVLTGLQLTRLTGQWLAPEASGNAQSMLLGTLQVLWEGLEDHRWKDGQLVAMQSELATIDLSADFIRAVQCMVRANTTHWLGMLDLPESQWRIPEGQSYSYTSEWKGMHRGWWYDCCIDLYNVGEDALANVTQSQASAGSLQPTWDDIYALPLNSNCEQLFQRTVNFGGGPNSQLLQFGQTSLNQARIAVAMERYRLSHGNNVTNLNQLVPTFLPAVPIDPILRRPLLFEPLTNGGYILRGVGWNRRNDRTNRSSDDWIWTYPTNTPTEVSTP